MSDRGSSYGELSAETFSHVVDAGADLAARALRYSRSLHEIATRPFEQWNLRAVVSEQFDRAVEISQLTARETKAQIDAAQALNETLVSQALRAQEAYLNSLRGVLDVAFSNLTFVDEAAAAPIDLLARRFEAYTLPAGIAASSN